MTGSELLQLAAKAAGYDYQPGRISVDGIPMKWNPLVDSGDAFLLAARLRMSVYRGGVMNCCASAWDNAGKRAEYEVPFRDIGHESASRRAIVMVAAEIGRRMP